MGILGEMVASKVEELHPTGTRVDAGKSVMICCVESGKRRLREDPTKNSHN
jgi:hypothetical protein